MENEAEESSISSGYRKDTSSSDGPSKSVGRVTRNATWTKSTERRHKRRKPQPRPGELQCPVCGVTLRPGDLQAHLLHELEKLARLPQSRPLYQRPPTTPDPSPTPTTSGIQFYGAASTSSSTSSSSSSSSSDRRGRWRSARKRRCPGWETYQRVRAGRQVRTRAKRFRVTVEDMGEEEWRVCPVCDLRVNVATLDEMGQHIQHCLRKAEEAFEDEEVDVEGDYEEYEWCGETRVRATQMLRAEGQLHALGTKVERGSEDEVVDVCLDDEDNFGPAQFNDEDLGGGGGGGREEEEEKEEEEEEEEEEGRGGDDDEGDEKEDINVDDEEESEGEEKDVNVDDEREGEGKEKEEEIIIDEEKDDSGRRPVEASCDSLSLPASSPNTLSESSAHAPCGDHPESQRENDDSNRVASDKANSVANNNSNNNAVVEALRARVTELEEERRSFRCTCRVCHGEYEKPLVSIACWHVHCEQCWLQALAAKKLCPQCSIITAPRELRRVYL